MTTRTIILAAFAGVGVLAAVLASAGKPPTAPPDVGATGRAPASHAEVAPPSRPAVAPPAPRRAVGSAGAAADVIGSTDPTSKDYDPLTLMRVMSVTPAEILNKEPRDPAFAGPRESALRERLTERLHKRLGFDAKIDASCRTSSCEITVQSANGTGDLAAAVRALEFDKLANAIQLGPTRVQGDSQAKGTSVIMLFSSALRDHTTYDQRLRQHEGNDAPPRAP